MDKSFVYFAVHVMIVGFGPTKGDRLMGAPPGREEPIRGIDKLRTEVIQREGSEAIYRQTGMIAHVRIHGLSIDDQAVRGTATLLQPAVNLEPRTTRLVSLG